MWLDGETRVLSVGQNTTAVDLTRRLCRGRKRVTSSGEEQPLVEDASEWAIFERQRHAHADGRARRASPRAR